MLAHIVGAGSKHAMLNQDSDGFTYLQNLVPVETSSWFLCVQRKVCCRLLKDGRSSARSTETTNFSAQASFSTGYCNSQEGSCLRSSLGSPDKRALVHRTDASGTGIGVTLSQATNLSASSREL